MSQEINFQYAFAVQNPSAPTTGQTPFKDSDSNQLRLDQSTAGGAEDTITIPTTAGGTVVSFGNVSSYGWLILKNLDQTNFATYGPTSGGAMVAMGKIKANEVQILRLKPGIVFRMLADTASVRINWRMYED